MASRQKPSLWLFGGIGPIRIAQRTWREMSDDDVYGKAAELSYYFLLALFPALLFIVSLLGLMAGPGTELRARLFQYMASVLPPSSSELVARTIGEVSAAAGGGKLTFGIVAALWAASGGLSALMSTLNAAYGVRETRGWLKSRGIALALTIEIAVLIIAALTLVLFGGQLGEWVAGKVGLGEVFAVAWKILQWPVVLVFLLTAFGSVYYFAPNLKAPEWYWVSPGAVVGLLVWMLASLGFRVYLQYFNSYSKTYGSLGTVIILMLWFYLSGLAVLIGGEVNSEIGHAIEEQEAGREHRRAA